jgi:hypothetical protein
MTHGCHHAGRQQITYAPVLASSPRVASQDGDLTRSSVVLLVRAGFSRGKLDNLLGLDFDIPVSRTTLKAWCSHVTAAAWEREECDQKGW